CIRRLLSRLANRAGSVDVVHPVSADLRISLGYCRLARHPRLDETGPGAASGAFDRLRPRHLAAGSDGRGPGHGDASELDFEGQAKVRDAGGVLIVHSS